MFFIYLFVCVWGGADPKEVTVDSDSTLWVLGLKLGSSGMVASTFSC